MQRDGIRDNRLLRLLTAGADIGPLTGVQLTARQVLKEPGVPTMYVYFPMTAVVSLISTLENGASTEVALIGREGMIGLTGVLGTVDNLTSAVVQVTGRAMRMPAPALRAARFSNPSVRAALDLYTQARFVQFAQTAACSRLHSVEQRLARWLLAIHDRIDGEEFVVPQEFIAAMLGVQRPTVSTRLQRLQERGAITRRGRVIVITNRAALETNACECYRIIDRELDRLLLPRSKRPELHLSPMPPSSAQSGDDVGALEAMREIAGRLLIVTIREQEALEQAEEANRAKDQFLATVSHELRQPMNVILGWCATLVGHQDQPPEHGLEVIARNARAQLKLIEDLLDAARITSSTLTIQPARVSLPDIIRDVVDEITPAAAEKQVVFRLTVADDVLLAVFADVDRLRQILLNVLMNSLKFTDTAGSVDVIVSSDAGRARVIVRDTGRGIAPAVVPHVFERFLQGATADDRRQGLGLGLSVARALVMLHGGTIRIESPGVNQGTTCTIELPLVDDRSESIAGMPAVHRQSLI